MATVTLVQKRGRLVSLHGGRLGIADDNSLWAGPSPSRHVTMPAVDVVITVGAEVTNVRALTIQLRDSTGRNIAYKEQVELHVFNAQDPTAYSGGGSTGIAIGANGFLATVLAKQIFIAWTDATGLLTLTYTDTGTVAGALGVRLPNGNTFVSDPITNA
jgi:hypothetical protein